MIALTIGVVVVAAAAAAVSLLAPAAVMVAIGGKSVSLFVPVSAGDIVRDTEEDEGPDVAAERVAGLDSAVAEEEEEDHQLFATVPDWE